MKVLISILIVVAVIFVAWKTWEYWDRVQTQKEAAEQAAKRPVDPRSLDGMDYRLEPSLQEVMDRKDPQALKAWLDRYRPVLKDPRLAWIELDYVLMVAPQNPVEAKRVYRAVKQRTPTNSPVYRRVKELEKTYD